MARQYTVREPNMAPRCNTAPAKNNQNDVYRKAEYIVLINGYGVSEFVYMFRINGPGAGEFVYIFLINGPGANKFVYIFLINRHWGSEFVYIFLINGPGAHEFEYIFLINAPVFRRLVRAHRCRTRQNRLTNLQNPRKYASTSIIKLSQSL